MNADRRTAEQAPGKPLSAPLAASTPEVGVSGGSDPLNGPQAGAQRFQTEPQTRGPVDWARQQAAERAQRSAPGDLHTQITAAIRDTPARYPDDIAAAVWRVVQSEVDHLREQAEAWRRKAVRRAIRISKLQGTLQAVTDLASEEITARTEWGDGYRAAIADLQEVLREFGHLPVTVPASSGEWLRAGTRDLSIPAHDAGPSVREAAANDRRWWNGEKTGEQ
ncbi:hypothetical protein [Streptomyces swartbergensis]|uniref:hypothetical protein n=1 Tax=Streptomyces swartbergensis TaxID=487165 RepID=UPI000D1CCFD7|nr:hypothetical protein [Streptomyces swartbergensis]